MLSTSRPQPLTTPAATPEPADSHHYSWVAFLRDTLDFFVGALKYYEELLSLESAEVEADPHLKAFFTEEVRQEIRFARGRGEATPRAPGNGSKTAWPGPPTSSIAISVSIMERCAT